jgi:hypothetical protein
MGLAQGQGRGLPLAGAGGTLTCPTA